MAILKYSLELTTAPTVEPVTVAEAKRNADEDDSHRDSDFAMWISEGRKQVEHDTRRSLINQTWTLKLDCFPSEDYIELLRPPLSSVTSIQYVDTDGNTQTFSSSSYVVDSARTPGIVYLAYNESWPSTRTQKNAVTVTYVAGYGATADSVPDWAKSAILIFCRHRYERPESAEIPMGFAALCQRGSWGDYP